jgi:nucleotide-binding universal stress UspA family protein
MGVVVVGVDGSENSVEALRWAAAQAVRTGAELRAVFVWEYPYMDIVSPGLGATLPPWSEMQVAARAALNESITRAQLPSGLRVARVVVEGSPSRMLLDESKDADLLVIGARGHGGFRGLVTGSVATQAVNHSTVPVTVIRTAEPD